MNRIIGALCLMKCLAGVSAHAASLSSAPFGKLADDTPVTRYVMTATSGVSVSFIDYGGIITDVVAPDRDGHRALIVLGFSTLRQYERTSAENELYFGQFSVVTPTGSTMAASTWAVAPIRSR